MSWVLWYERGDDGWIVRRTGWSFGQEGGLEQVGSLSGGAVRWRVPSRLMQVRAATLAEMVLAMEWLSRERPLPAEQAIARQHERMRAGDSFAKAALAAGSAQVGL